MSRGRPASSARAVAVIPARYASTRLPGKPLLEAGGRPLIEHVYRRATQARCVARAVVATDDPRIVEAVQAFGGTARLTRGDHATGSDRIGELLPELDEEIIINVQGDEPEVEPDLLDALVDRLLDDAALCVTTAVAPFPANLDRADPNQVKVVVDRRDRALYFSRAPIPFCRGAVGDGAKCAQALLHVGVYAYRRQALKAFLDHEQGVLERLECLEQLRLLENGMPIGTVKVGMAHCGIDTPEDMEAFRERLANPERDAPG